jgi:hypothetical protein
MGHDVLRFLLADSLSFSATSISTKFGGKWF